MPRETLIRSMHQLQDEILLLGSMVEQAVLKSVDILKRRDLPAAHRLYEDDRLINDKRYAIENAIIILIATQQPMAHDLRMLAAILEVTTELERMGDYAKGIAKVTQNLSQVEIEIPSHDIELMAKKGVDMLHRSLTAFTTENASLASRIPAEDDEVDDMFIKIYHKLVAMMIANPEIIDHANHLMWVAHNLERLADRVTNICERTVFLATGELIEIESGDDDEEEEID